MAESRIILLRVCSDTHGYAAPAFDPTTVSAILHAGDLYDAAVSRQALPHDPMESWLAACAVPVFLVRGNHDHRDPLGIFERHENVTGRIVPIAPGLLVAGVGFAPREFYDLPGETDLKPMCRDILRWARRLIGTSDRVVLLTHYPANLPGVYLEHEASEGEAFDCVRELIEELGPVAVIQGHVHEWFGQTHMVQMSGRPVLMVNPGPLGGVLRLDIERGEASYAPASG